MVLKEKFRGIKAGSTAIGFDIPQARQKLTNNDHVKEPLDVEKVLQKYGITKEEYEERFFWDNEDIKVSK